MDTNQKKIALKNILRRLLLKLQKQFDNIECSIDPIAYRDPQVFAFNIYKCFFNLNGVNENTPTKEIIEKIQGYFSTLKKTGAASGPVPRQPVPSGDSTTPQKPGTASDSDTDKSIQDKLARIRQHTQGDNGSVDEWSEEERVEPEADEYQPSLHESEADKSPSYERVHSERYKLRDDIREANRTKRTNKPQSDSHSSDSHSSDDDWDEDSYSAEIKRLIHDEVYNQIKQNEKGPRDVMNIVHDPLFTTWVRGMIEAQIRTEVSFMTDDMKNEMETYKVRYLDDIRHKLKDIINEYENDLHTGDPDTDRAV